MHGTRHPQDRGAAEVGAFLTDLAVAGNVAPRTQRQALNARVFLYRHVLEVELGPITAVPSRRPKRLPVVLAPEEVKHLLEAVEGAEGMFRTLVELLSGAGLRVSEGCQLRVQEVDFARDQVLVRGGKGDKDRIVMRPRSPKPKLAELLERRRPLFERDQRNGVNWVWLPHALGRQYPGAGKQLGWQFLFALPSILP